MESLISVLDKNGKESLINVAMITYLEEGDDKYYINLPGTYIELKDKEEYEKAKSKIYKNVRML